MARIEIQLDIRRRKRVTSKTKKSRRLPPWMEEKRVKRVARQRLVQSIKK